jgi:glucosylceramidase
MVIVMHNDTHEVQKVSIMVGNQVITPALPPDSFSTFVIPA